MAEMYLYALADGFSRTLNFIPRTRCHFYVADTLNPTLWPVGGGFFIVHAGLIREIKDEKQFAFLVALELAHEMLGHNFQPVRAGDIKWEPGLWRNGQYDGWPVEFWAYLVGRDPLQRGGFQYTLQQESDALELVYRFFRANLWNYDAVSRAVADLIPTFGAIPGASSLPSLHANLKMATLLPHETPAPGPIPVDPAVSESVYRKVQEDVLASALQHYPWMLELVPYRDLVLERGINLDRARREYNPHAEVLSQKYLNLSKKPRKQSKSGELGDLDDRNEDLESRDKVPGAQLARLYLKGAILLAHHQWEAVAANSAEGLKIDAAAEPFLWQRASARQQQGRFKECIKEMGATWHWFDHRRRIMELSSTFLDGRYSDAFVLANDYRRQYPFDIEGAFWQTLTLIRMRRSLESSMVEIESFWGDRPLVRALQIFHYGYLGQFSRARAALEFRSDIEYLPFEWGAFEFAQAWLRLTFNELHDDDRAEKLLKLAALQWPLAPLVRYNLPRDAVQSR
jgi:hypothetical protein